MVRRAGSLWLVASVVVVSAGAAQRKPLPKVLDQAFDAAIDSVLKAWKVPGLGIGVVKGNRIVLLKGYGFKNLEEKIPVTPTTKFAIGSVTKSFAVTALAAQAAAGLFDWDAPVRRYLPDFQMFDAAVSERMTPATWSSTGRGSPVTTSCGAAAPLPATTSTSGSATSSRPVTSGVSGSTRT